LKAYIAVALLALAAIAAVSPALPAAAEQAYAWQGETRFIVLGPGAGEAVRLVGSEPLVDAGDLAAAVLDPLQVAALKRQGYIVTIDPIVRLVEPQLAPQQLQATPQAYSDLVNAGPLHQQGVTGSGVIVAVVDTGVDEVRPELAGKQAWEYDATGTGQQGYCGKGLGLPYSAHGTMVAGIIFSSDAQLLGVAPDATLYDVIIARPELGCGGAYLSDIYNGLLAAARGSDGQLGTADDADVINLSFGTVVLPWNWYYMLSPIDDYSAAYARLMQLMEDLRHDYGINVVVAAGNVGPATGTVSPFCAASLCAGSVQQLTDIPSIFSSRGPDAFLRPAPHVMAPGENLTVLVPLEFGSTTIASGTSFSAPMASGTLALLRQLLPNASALDLEALIVAGGGPLSVLTWDFVRVGGTRVDAAGAAGKLVAASFIVEGVARPEALYPVAAVWSGSSAQLRVKNLGDAEITLAASAQVVPGLLAPEAAGQAQVTPSTVTLAPGEEAVLTVTASSTAPGVAGILVRLTDAATGEVVALALASLVEPLEPGERIAIETSLYDWGFLPVPLRAPQPGVYTLDVYSYTLPVETVVWDGTGPDATPATLLLAGDAVAYLNPIPFITAYPLAGIVKVEVAFSAITLQSLDDLYNRLQLLEERLNLLEARVDAVEAQLARLDLLEAALENLAVEVETVKQELETVKAGLEEQRAVNEEQWSRLQLLEERLDSLEAQLLEVRGEIAALKASLEQLSARIEEVNARVEKVSGDLAALEARVGELEGELARVNARIGELESGLAEAALKLAEVQDRLARVEGELAAVQEDIAGITLQLAQLGEDLARLEAETARTVEELRAGLDQVALQLAQLDANVQDALQNVAAAIDAAVQRIEALEESLENLKSQAEETRKTVEELQAAMASAEEAIARHEEAIAALEAAVEEAAAAIEELRAALNELAARQDTLEEKVETLQSEQSRIEDRATLAAGAAAGLALLALAGLAARKLLEG